MPTLITRGAASGRGFGLFESGITTRKETFTSSGSWVCPAGVTSLIYVRGKGQDGTSDYYAMSTNYYVGVKIAVSTGGDNPPYLDWSTIYGEYLSDINSIPDGGFAGPGGQTRTSNYRVYIDNSWSVSTGSVRDWNGYYINDVTPGSSSPPPPTSGTMTYSTMTNGNWVINVSYVAFGSAGADTTAFGYTFSGGTLSGSYPNQTGNAAAVTTYTSVAVTPGTTYNFVVPAGGSVTFAYYT